MFVRTMIALMLLGAVACRDQTRTERTIAAQGTVVHMDLEGDFYGLVSDTGDKYLPENLEGAYRRDSLRVAFEGIITDRPTAMMWGRTLRITRIEALR